MIFLIISVVLFTRYFILQRKSLKLEAKSDHKKSKDARESADVSLAFACISLGLLIACQITNYYNQVNDLERLSVINREIEVHKERAKDITGQLETILVDKYSDHEAKVFESLSGEGISIYLAKYPELNSHKTFMHMSETLTKLSDKEYRSKLKALDLEKDIKSRKRYIHVLPFFLPGLN